MKSVPCWPTGLNQSSVIHRLLTVHVCFEGARCVVVLLFVLYLHMWDMSNILYMMYILLCN